MSNNYVQEWVEKQSALTKPDHIVWITGDEAQLAELRKQALATGELIELNQELLPGCYH